MVAIGSQIDDVGEKRLGRRRRVVTPVVIERGDRILRREGTAIMERGVRSEFERPHLGVRRGAPRDRHVAAQGVVFRDLREVAAEGVGQLDLADALVLARIERIGGDRQAGRRCLRHEIPA